MEYTDDNMILLAQDMICRMEVQDLHFQNDSNLYGTQHTKYKGPFMELVDYFKEVIVEEGEKQIA